MAVFNWLFLASCRRVTCSCRALLELPTPLGPWLWNMLRCSEFSPSLSFSFLPSCEPWLASDSWLMRVFFLPAPALLPKDPPEKEPGAELTARLAPCFVTVRKRSLDRVRAFFRISGAC